MAPEQFFLRKLASRAWVILFGILLILCVHYWPDRDGKFPSIRIAPRDAEIGDFGDGTDVHSNATLMPRQDYQCGPGNPCSNGACCGGSGYCGYGPAYCGSGCVSNCDAVAECGQYAKTPDTECPLNTCCSQYGFCGTTEDFCGEGCQNNCVLNPSPPAHTGLLGRSIQSTPSLQDVDKALSNPQAVIQDLAGSNGQNCFAYKGDCVNINDNNAMAQACGDGNTPIGWDDAGCGKKNCHCGKPICCPINAAPKNCIWRGNNNGGGTGSDCSAQCAPGETNIRGIGSSWGGGFLNDGNTDKCGRGYKVFCCSNPDFQQVTQGCSYAPCRSNCPTGQTSVFTKTDNCFIGSQQYCCPDPAKLAACHWVGGSGGKECTNAVCNATELEVDRAQFGGSSIGGCSWGRSRAACCTVQKAPPRPASCSADLCKLLPGYCPNDNDDESADNYTKRDLALFDTNNSASWRALEKRGSGNTYYVDIGNNVGIRIIAVAYPAIAELFGVQNASQVLRRFFRLILGYCTGPSIQEGTIPPGDSPPGLAGLQVEHPIDRQVMVPFAQASASGILPSGQVANIPAIPRNFWKNQWLASNDLLAARPAVGGPNGVQPDSPNDRVMEGFGSSNWPYPFLAVDKLINGPKGRIMRLHDATAIGNITLLANTAVREDTQGAADDLLQSIRVGFATFEYLNTPHAILRWNAIRQQVRLQFSYIEQDLGVANLVAWWDLFTNDYFALVGQNARRWAYEAIEAAATPFAQAHDADRNLQTYEQVLGALEEMLQQITGMNLPPDTSMQNPQSPGGGGGGS